MQRYTPHINPFTGQPKTRECDEGDYVLFTEAQSRISQLEERLAAMTEDRNLWKDEHLGDCPAESRLKELEAENGRLKKEIQKVQRDVDTVWAERNEVLALYQKVTDERDSYRSANEALKQQIETIQTDAASNYSEAENRAHKAEGVVRELVKALESMIKRYGTSVKPGTVRGDAKRALEAAREIQR